MEGFEGFEEEAGVLKTGVRGVAAFGFVAHSRAVGAAGVGGEVVGSGGVPVGTRLRVRKSEVLGSGRGKGMEELRRG